MIENDPDLELAGVAENGEEAVKLALELAPDVVTMDLMMPVLSGFDAIRVLKAAGGPPVIVVSGVLDPRHERSVFAALELGAVSVRAKPHGLPDSDPAAVELLEEIKAVAAMPRGHVTAKVSGVRRTAGLRRRIIRAVGIAASTGGPQALRAVLSALGRHFSVPVLVVQHMTPGFLSEMAGWLETATGLNVIIAKDGLQARPGAVYLAPDGAHMLLEPDLVLRLDRTGAAGRHRPSADPMFQSLASATDGFSAGVVLSGMGSDGARGIATLHDRGGWVIAQDRASSVVWGMPGSAVQAGAVDEVLPLGRIGPRLVELVNPTRRPLVRRGV